MRRYLVFRGEVCYPGGGWHDYFGDADTIEEATAMMGAPHEWAWAHIVDTETTKIEASE